MTSRVLVTAVAALALLVGGALLSIAGPSSLPPSPVIGLLTSATPSADYTVSLGSGDDFNASLVRQDGTATLTATLASPEGAELATATAAETSVPVSLEATAGDAGLYVLSIKQADASEGTTAAFSLEWTRVKSTHVELYVNPAVTEWGGSTLLDYGVWDSGGFLIGGLAVLERSYDGQTWTREQDLVVPGALRSVIAFTPTRRTYLRVRFLGDAGNKPSTSAPVVVNRKAVLTPPTSPARVARDSYFQAYGYMKPRHGVGTRHVRIRCYRLEDGEWVWKRTRLATVSKYSTVTNKYAARVSLPSAGRWRMRAYVPEDGYHAESTSDYTYLKVNPTTFAITADKTLSRQGQYPPRLTGVLRDINSRPLADKPVSLEWCTNGKDWYTSYRRRTSSTGRISMEVTPSKNTYYRFRFAGDANQLPSASGRLLIRVWTHEMSGHGSKSEKVYLLRGRAHVHWQHTEPSLRIRVIDRDGIERMNRTSANAGNVIEYGFGSAFLPYTGYYTVRVSTTSTWTATIF